MPFTILLQRCLAWALVSIFCLGANAWTPAVDYTGICPRERSELDLPSICLSPDSLIRCSCYMSEATDIDVVPPFDLLPAGLIRLNCYPVVEGADLDMQQFQMFIELCGENCYCVNHKKGKHVEGYHPPVWSQRHRSRLPQAEAAAIIEAQLQAIIEKRKAEEEEARARAIAATWPAITYSDPRRPPRPPPPPPGNGGRGGGGAGGGGQQSSGGGGGGRQSKYGDSTRFRKTSGKDGQGSCGPRCTQMQRCLWLSTRNSCANDLVCAPTSMGTGFYLSPGRCISRALLALSSGQLSEGSTGILGGRSVHEANEEEEQQQQQASWATQFPIGDLACFCNATYLSRGCCDAAEGLVWEPVDLNLAVRMSGEDTLLR